MTIAWGAGGLEFTLTTPCPDAFGRARMVMAPWLRNDAAPEPVIEWQMERDGSGWRVSGYTDGNPRFYPLLEDALMSVEFTSVCSYLEDRPMIWLHSALLEKNGAAVAVMGQSGSGKSTLAVAAWRSGWSLLSDDSSLLDPVTAEVQAVPRRVSLRAPSKSLVGAELWQQLLDLPSTAARADGLMFQPAELDGRSPACRLPLRSIVLLGRPGAPDQFGQCSSGDALRYILLQSGLARRGLGAALGRLQDALARVSLWDVPRAPLREMLRNLERLV